MNILKFIESFTNEGLLNAKGTRRDSFGQFGALGKGLATAALPFGLGAIALNSNKANAASAAFLSAAAETPIQALQLALTLEYLEEEFSISKLTTELNDNNAEFYFAKLDNNVIGYLKLNFGKSQTELQDNGALEIERIYVLNEYHGKNVGKLLYNKAKQIARQHGADYIWLGVWEENPKAIYFYKKNGFVAFDKHIFKLGNDEQIDIMMKLKLNN